MEDLHEERIKLEIIEHLVDHLPQKTRVDLAMFHLNTALEYLAEYQVDNPCSVCSDEVDEIKVQLKKHLQALQFYKILEQRGVLDDWKSMPIYEKDKIKRGIEKELRFDI